MPKPICVQCGLFLRPKKNEVYVEERAPTGAPPTEEWKPYKIWCADLWHCRKCGFEVILGFGSHPIAEHYKVDEYQRAARLINYVVNDC